MLKMHPAYLFVGSEKEIYDYLTTALKEVFCSNSSKAICRVCKNIENRKHESIRFIEPEGQYTISQLNIIFDNIIFKLNAGEHYFFIINKADLLNISCSNKLLKSLEEPPAGYHFILVTSRLDSILETILSRCVIKDFSKQNIIENNILFNIFININHNINMQDIKELENTKIPNYLIANLIDHLYDYYHNNLKTAISEQNNKKIDHISQIIEVLDKSKRQYPMPGSSKIFLKNLYLQILSIFIDLKCN